MTVENDGLDTFRAVIASDPYHRQFMPLLARIDMLTAALERVRKASVEMPIPRGSLVWHIAVSNGSVVALGEPNRTENEDAPLYHNCDAMGCGAFHVIARASILTAAQITPTETNDADR